MVYKSKCYEQFSIPMTGPSDERELGELGEDREPGVFRKLGERVGPRLHTERADRGEIRPDGGHCRSRPCRAGGARLGHDRCLSIRLVLGLGRVGLGPRSFVLCRAPELSPHFMVKSGGNRLSVEKDLTTTKVIAKGAKERMAFE